MKYDEIVVIDEILKAIIDNYIKNYTTVVETV